MCLTLLVLYPVYNHHEDPDAAESQLKLGISRAKTPRPQRSENKGQQLFQDNSLFPPNLACFASWRESIPLFENFRFVMSNNKCLHLRVTTLGLKLNIRTWL